MKDGLRIILFSGLMALVALISSCTDADLKKGRHYQREKDYDQAIHFFQLALDKDSESSSARYGLVETYAQKLIEQNERKASPEMIEEAMVELRPIAEPLMNDPNIKRYISLIYQAMAKVYADQERHDKAAEGWAEVIEIEPYYAEGHFNLGVATAKMQQYEQSMQHFEKTVELNPYFIKGYFAMGNSLIQLNRNEEAIKQFSKALEINPDDSEVRHNLAIAYSRMGNKEKAVEELEKVIETEPGYMLAYSSLAGIYANQGDTEKAEEVKKRWNEYAETYLQTPEGEDTSPVSLDASG